MLFEISTVHFLIKYLSNNHIFICKHSYECTSECCIHVILIKLNHCATCWNIHSSVGKWRGVLLINIKKLFLTCGCFHRWTPQVHVWQDVCCFQRLECFTNNKYKSRNTQVPGAVLFMACCQSSLSIQSRSSWRRSIDLWQGALWVSEDK